MEDSSVVKAAICKFYKVLDMVWCCVGEELDLDLSLGSINYCSTVTRCHQVLGRRGRLSGFRHGSNAWMRNVTMVYLVDKDAKYQSAFIGVKAG